jgi:hypothetical protein
MRTSAIAVVWAANCHPIEIRLTFTAYLAKFTKRNKIVNGSLNRSAV